MREAVNYIALAVPVFFLLIGIELLVGKLKKTKLYRFNDAVTNISCGIGQQVFGVFIKTLLLLAYVWIYEHYKFMEFSPSKWWTWAILFLGVDFFYYWFHRYAHEISIMWGGHIVHHQSEEYNLSVALRQGAFQALFSWVFYLPLAFFGFDPITFVVVNQFQTLYQFWIHTRAIDKLPRWFEFIFNTPSHHRVHHGVNPKYIDRNHGGTLIIWDRMFGTFQAEEEEVVYGITKPLSSWNPVWANLDYFRDVFRLMRQCRNPLDKLRVLFKGPGWRPDYLGGPLEVREGITPQTFDKYDTEVPSGLNYYVLFQYVILLGGTSFFLFTADKFGEMFGGWQATFWKFALGGLIMLSIASLGGLLERKRWAAFVEYLRIALLVAAPVAIMAGTAQLWLAGLTAGAIALVSLVWVLRYRGVFVGGRKVEAAG